MKTKYIDYRKLFVQSWEFVVGNDFLILLNFLSVINGLLFSFVLLTYQGYSTYFVAMFPHKSLLHEMERLAQKLFHTPEIGIYFLICFWIIAFIRLYLPQFTDAAILSQAWANTENKTLNKKEILISWWKKSFTILEINVLLGIFDLTSLFGTFGFLYRIEPAFLPFLLPLGLWMAFLWIFFHYGAIFARPIVLSEWCSALEAIGKSLGLTLLHIRHTLIIFFFLFIIGIRLIINMILVITIPFVLSFVASWLSFLISEKWAIVVLWIVWCIAFLFVARFIATLEVLLLALWTNLYKELKTGNYEE